MPKPTAGFVRVTRDFPCDLFDSIGRVADELGVTRNCVIESAVAELIRRHDAGKRLPPLVQRKLGRPAKADAKRAS